MALTDIGDVRRRALDLAEAGIDGTPKEAIAGEGKWAVRRVLADDGSAPGRPAGSSASPVLLIPPLMVRPLVFDLQPDHSLVRRLRDRGLGTYVLDLGVPDDGDRGVTLDDYVLEVIPRAVEAVRRHAESERVSLLGYCMGGLFSLIQAALHPEAKVGRIVTIGSPVDFSRMGWLGALGRWGAGRVDPVVDALGVVPGWMANAGFQLLSGRRALARLFELRDRQADEAYLRAYGSISRWLSGLVPYPGEAFKQFLRQFMHDNRMHDAQLSFGGRPVDLASIRGPVLAFAGESDAIAPPAAVVAIRRHLPPERVSVRSVPGGHLSMLGGPAAPAAVWEPSAEFLLGP